MKAARWRAEPEKDLASECAGAACDGAVARYLYEEQTMSVVSKTVAAVLMAALPIGAALAQNGADGGSGNSSGDRACGESVWVGGCGGITLRPALDEVTGSISTSKRTSAVDAATGKRSAAKAGSPAAGKVGARAGQRDSTSEHNRGKDNAGLNAGPGNGGEGASGEHGDRDPGNSGSHNNAPDSRGGKSKGKR
jgi:hypothetical protein